MDGQDFIRYITIKKGLSSNSVRLCKVRFNIINNWLKENNKELNKDCAGVSGWYTVFE